MNPVKVSNIYIAFDRMKSCKFSRKNGRETKYEVGQGHKEEANTVILVFFLWNAFSLLRT